MIRSHCLDDRKSIHSVGADMTEAHEDASQDEHVLDYKDFDQDESLMLLFASKSFSRREICDFLIRKSTIKDVNFRQGTIEKARTSILRTKINRQFTVTRSGGTTNSSA